MKRSTFRKAALSLAAATILATGACSFGFSGKKLQELTADRIARPAFLTERVVTAGQFELMAWERMQKTSAPATIYIEGDGLAWITPWRKSIDPTPTNPVALRLAARDRDGNVGWLGRPCQYTGAGPERCPSRYWTDARFAPEVIAAYHEALDNMKDNYKLTGFHLVGYSGGAAVAALVAAERDDVLSLRSVAGNLDHVTWTQWHDISPLTDSLNPVAVASDLADIPQYHFTGGQDKIIPPAIFHSWKQASGETDCVRHEFIVENEHEDGWAEKWPALLNRPLECDGPPPPPVPEPAPVPQEFLDAKK